MREQRIKAWWLKADKKLGPETLGLQVKGIELMPFLPRLVPTFVLHSFPVRVNEASRNCWPCND